MSAVLLDLTSADVLGIGHRLSDLTSDVPFTTGVPAVLGEQPAAPRLARAFARRQRAEAGLVARSTLHALWDLLCASATPSHHVLLDAGAYPIAHWATAAARQNGAGVDQVTHYDAAAFSRAAAAAARTRNRIILVLDGSCPGCGQVAPLEDIGWVAERYGALVIVDDTLACGVLGTAPSMLDPLGVDGVGSSAFTNVISERHVTVASLAKAYGAPLTMLTGPAGVVDRLRAGGTRIHCSPSSAADIAAATRSLLLERTGLLRLRRRRLAAITAHLHERLAEAGLAAISGPLPTVAIKLPRDTALHLHRRLLAAGIRTTVQGGRCWEGAMLAMTMRADLRDSHVERVTAELLRFPAWRAAS